MLQKSGVPLLSSLFALERQTTLPPVKRILSAIRQDLLRGKPFSQALGRHPRMFSPVYRNLVRVGEVGGVLDQMLWQLAKLFEWELGVRTRLREALTYPMIVIVTLIVALTLTLALVLPQFSQMFLSFRIQLPLQTRLLIGFSHLVSHYGWLLLLLAVASGFGLASCLRTDAGRDWWHAAQLRLPIVGRFILEFTISRFARVTASLTRSGVPILETLTLASESLSNRAVKRRLESVYRRVKGGTSLGSALAAEPMFPAMVTQMVATGEETGRLDELLHHVSEYYEQQVTIGLRRLITYLEPALLLVISLGVLLMAIAVYLPMWDLVKVFKQGPAGP
jgi:MSHA biogenesis protein MshG